MPVTHSPGNPFAFSPAQIRKPSFLDEETSFKHYRSPTPTKKSSAVLNVEDQTHKLEYQLKECQESLAREKVLSESRIEDLERRLLDEGKKFERTETDKRFLFDLQAKQALEIENLTAELTQTKTSSDGIIRELRATNGRLTDQLIKTRDECNAEKQAKDREVHRVQGQLDNQRRAMDALKVDLSSKNDMLATKNKKIAELEKLCDDQVLAQPTGSSEELGFVTKELATALSKIASLETASGSLVAKIHKLQETNASLSVVSEEKLTLEKKLQMMEEMREQLVAAQLRLVDLEKERALWSDFVEDGESVDVANVLARQKSDVENFKTQIKQLESQLVDSNVLTGNLKADLRDFRVQVEDLNTELLNKTRTNARLERGKAMATREVNFLREQLKSYDLEEQVEIPNFDALKTKRVEELERLMEEYRAQLTQSTEQEENKVVLGIKRGREEETDFNEIERGEYLRKIRSLNADLEITKREDALLRKEVTALREQAQKYLVATSESSTGSPHRGRILQYRDNPTTKYQTIRTHTLKDLKSENEALLAELSGKGGVTVPIQTLRNAESENRRIEETLRQKEKMIQRLKEVFAAKSSEFREAVYSLLGYKLDFLPNGRVKLTSMYAAAEGPNDLAFIFDGEAGTMQLSGGPEAAAAATTESPNRETDGGIATTSSDKTREDGQFGATVDNLIKYWSGEKNSIPGMLAALTLELLDREGTVSPTI